MSIPNNADIKLAQEINLLDSVTAMNIYYFISEFAETQTDEDVLDTLETWVENLYTEINAEMISGVSLGLATLYVWNSVLVQWDNHGTFTPSVSFNNASDMLPHGVAALVRMYSEASRSIGRKYLAGFGEDMQSDGDWAAGAITNLGSFLTRWSAKAEVSVTNDLYPGVWSTTAHVVYRTAQEGVILAQPAYQRRRRPGVGI